MNNAEVVSEWKSPPRFPSSSPSLSNKEAMLPWRQWSFGSPSANYRLLWVKNWTNGCLDQCCCCHRHGDPIGWALLFDWISDLVFERKKYLKECHLCANLQNVFYEMKMIIYVRENVSVLVTWHNYIHSLLWLCNKEPLPDIRKGSEGYGCGFCPLRDENLPNFNNHWTIIVLFNCINSY